MRGKKVEQVYDEIKRMLYVNALAPGQKLIYRDLAKRLNTSITPIVQALKALKEANFVQYVPNKGYCVGEITENEAKELFQAREALETYLVSQVIENLDRSNINSLKDSYIECRKTFEPAQRRARIIKDASFHLKIAEYAGNKVIYNLLEDILEHMVLRYKPEYLYEVRLREADGEHRSIVEALEEGDAEKTQTLMRMHIRNGLKHVLQRFEAEQFYGRKGSLD